METMKQPSRSKKICQITERDYKMLRFIWKWKAVSTAALAMKFYPNSTSYTCYRRLLYLANDSYIDNYSLKVPNTAVWILKQKGFKYIRPYLDELSAEGYKSANYPHDYLASSFHLGEWLIHQPDNSQTVSEQQLRCFDSELLPKWIPTSKLHRPDGYSTYHLQEQRIIVAFEAELTVKASTRYEGVVSFYDNEDSINLVLWLVNNVSSMDSIEKFFKKYNVKDISKHQFILLADFLKDGWMAEVIRGKYAGQKVINLLQHKAYSNPPQNILGSVTQALLNSRKRPIFTKK
jgi:hypothetical protein